MNGEAGVFCRSTSDQGGVSLICAKFLRRVKAPRRNRDSIDCGTLHTLKDNRLQSKTKAAGRACFNVTCDWKMCTEDTKSPDLMAVFGPVSRLAKHFTHTVSGKEADPADVRFSAQLTSFLRP